MPASTDPNFGLKYGYALGENGWGTDMSNNLKKIGALIHLSVLSRELSAPPPTPSDGDRYIVGPEATGDWATHEDEIAIWIGSAWEFYVPNFGWQAVVQDSQELVVFRTSWSSTVSGQPYDLHVTYNGRMDNGVTLLRCVFPRTTTFQAGLADSYALSEVSATNSSACTIAKNGASVGTITWAGGSSTGVFAMASDQVFNAGDVMEITAPAVSDPTLADISITIVGIR